MPTPTSPSSTWSELRAACERGDLPASALIEHRPVAAVLTCSDARVSPARLFDQPEGSLFVVRVAGNIANAESVASLTYAVDHLGVDTIIVLGHSHCGAVTAAVGGSSEPAMACVVDPIRAALMSGGECDDLPCAIERNVLATAETLRADPGSLGTAIHEGRIALHGAVLDLETSRVVEIMTPDLPGNPESPDLPEPPDLPNGEAMKEQQQ